MLAGYMHQIIEGMGHPLYYPHPLCYPHPNIPIPFMIPIPKQTTLDPKAQNCTWSVGPWCGVGWVCFGVVRPVNSSLCEETIAWAKASRSSSQDFNFGDDDLHNLQCQLDVLVGGGEAPARFTFPIRPLATKFLPHPKQHVEQ